MTLVEHINSILRWLVAMAVIFGVCWLYKNQTKVVIEHSDVSMDSAVLPEGSYNINAEPNTPNDLRQGDIVAYYVPGGLGLKRVARVAAVAGQTIEVKDGAVKVDGAPTALKVDERTWVVPATRVPRGCVFVLADNSRLAKDSMCLGPLPFFQVLGKVKY